jgi:hypothetical protein
MKIGSWRKSDRLTSSWFFLRYFLVKYLRYRLEKGVEAVKTSLAPEDKGEVNALHLHLPTQIITHPLGST